MPLSDKAPVGRAITHVERTFTEIVSVVPDADPSLIDQAVLTILQYWEDHGVHGGTVRCAVPGGDDLTYKAHRP